MDTNTNFIIILTQDIVFVNKTFPYLVFISCFSGEGFTAVFTNIPPEIAVVKARGNIALENLDLIIQTLPFSYLKQMNKENCLLIYKT